MWYVGSIFLHFHRVTRSVCNVGIYTPCGVQQIFLTWKRYFAFAIRRPEITRYLVFGKWTTWVTDGWIFRRRSLFICTRLQYAFPSFITHTAWNVIILKAEQSKFTFTYYFPCILRKSRKDYSKDPTDAKYLDSSNCNFASSSAAVPGTDSNSSVCTVQESSWK